MKGLDDILQNLDKVEAWTRKGMTEKQIADKFGISRATFWKCKKANADILNALKKGRVDLGDDLKMCLAKKAFGFTYTEKKTITKYGGDNEIKTVEEYERYSPPDVAAIHLLLKNIDKDWRNDDQTTLNLKREKLEMEKAKADAENW